MSILTIDAPCLRIFLCHASEDKELVRDLSRRLSHDGFDPWLDEEKLIAGQDWKYQITKAVRSADVVLVCISKDSLNKSGYVQYEIKYALDIADEQPEEMIFLIPLRLEECKVPDRLRRYQWVNFFEDGGYDKLKHSLEYRQQNAYSSQAH